MRINIVLGPFQPMPPSGIGAVEKVWHQLALLFSRSGHAVTLIGKVAEADNRSGQQEVVVKPLKGYSASGHLWLDLVQDLIYAIAVLRHIGPGDVVVTNSFWSPVILSWFGKRAGRIIVHVARFPKGQMRLYGRVQVLQAISSAIAEEVVRQAPSLQEKVRIVPYPIDLAVFAPPLMNRDFGGVVTILYVGRIHPEKGLEMLLAAFALASEKLPRVRLRVVGPHSRGAGGGGDEYFAKLRLAAAGLPVHFAGPVSNQLQLSAEYAQAHCFCYPSRAEKGEAFGLSVLEAMASGLPVVVSGLACFLDLIENSQQGLRFDHRSDEASLVLAECLISIFTVPGLALRLSENARARAERFEVGRIAADYLALFEEAKMEIAPQC